ncbi:MAG: glycosyltransferase family 4 protein [Ignavibacterium sp.]
MEATTLQKNGYEVSVICPQKYNYTKSYEVIESINIYRYPLLLEANKSPLAFLFEFISCFLFTSFLSIKVLFINGFNIIHICNPPETYFSLAIVYKLFGKKIIFDHHDLSPEMYLAKQTDAKEDSFYFKLLLWMEKMTFKVSHTVITTNESHKKVAVERGRKAPEYIFIVRSGPNIERFKGYEYKEELKRGKKYLVCYLGEMCEQDGVGPFLTELKKYDSQFFKENVQFVFIGKGPEQPNLVIKNKELGLEEYVFFTGRVSDLDLANNLYTADLCFDTSPYNSWTDRSTMNKIIEYMAFRNPIVSFDLTESKYSAQESAHYVERGNYNKFFQCIEGLLSDEVKRKQMAEIGNKRFKEQLQWSNSIPNLLAAYQKTKI